jgi:hypothetical protein
MTGDKTAQVGPEILTAHDELVKVVEANAEKIENLRQRRISEYEVTQSDRQIAVFN